MQAMRKSKDWFCLLTKTDGAKSLLLFPFVVIIIAELCYSELKDLEDSKIELYQLTVLLEECFLFRTLANLSYFVP